MSEKEKYKTKEFSEATGIPVGTLTRWSSQGIFVPTSRNGKGKPSYYTAEQIEPAKALHAKAKRANAQTSADLEEAVDEVTAADNIEAEESAVEAYDDLNTAVKAADSPDNAPEMSPPMSDTNDAQNAAADATESVSAEKEGVDVEASADLPSPLFFHGFNLSAGQDNEPIYTPDPNMSPDERAKRILFLETLTAAGAIAQGLELIAAKSQVKHGKWKSWLAGFGWNERTAQNRMQLARRFGNKRAFAELSKSALDVLLPLPEGEEIKFIESEASAGKPVEEQNVRELKKSVDEYKAVLQTSDPEFEKSSGKSLVESGTLFDLKDLNRVDVETEGDSSAEFLAVPAAPEFDTLEKSYKPPIANVSKEPTNEWYTPAEICEAARRVMGAIELDPASCEKANQTVKATKFYSVDDNGLSQEWSGRVWLNPPYSKIAGTNSADETTAAFADKLIASFKSGSVTEAIWLSHNKTDTRWFARLAELSAAIIFSHGRINFLREGTEIKGSSQHGQAFIYFGNNPEKFISEFIQFGWAAKFIPLPTPSMQEQTPF